MTTTAILPETTTHLRRLKSGLVIPATSGKRTFVTERNMFPGYFDEDFIEYGIDVPSKAMPEIDSELYEMTGDGDFRKLLGSFKLDLDLLFWKSQDQALTWIENHPNDLHPKGWATFFPFIVGKKKFVAYVYRLEGELRAFVYHFESGLVWCAEFQHRLVFPQLTA